MQLEEIPAVQGLLTVALEMVLKDRKVDKFQVMVLKCICIQIEEILTLQGDFNYCAKMVCTEIVYFSCWEDVKEFFYQC